MVKIDEEAKQDLYDALLFFQQDWQERVWLTGMILF